MSFWPAVHTLTELGLVERVGVLLDGDDAEAEIIHPYAIRGGEPAERELAAAAEMAARAMVTEGQFSRSVERGYHLVPVRKHITKAAVAEVFRLKYRPHTTATAALVCPDAANHRRISRPLPSDDERPRRCKFGGIRSDAISRLDQGLIKARSKLVQ